MNPKQLAQWMHEEHARVHDLATTLREAIAKVPLGQRGEWLGSLRERYEHLRAHLHMHMALEERDGYLPTVAAHRPSLSKEVDRLRHEHDELTRIMDGIRRDLDELHETDPLLIHDCCRRIENLINFVEHHEQDENLIVLSVYTDEIGTKD
jgi:iron-sulfur cluster repair protein YtfE (RIC family)